MKVKRFFAKDISGAIRNVRVDLGVDAVILSNRDVDGGIEIVAAVDYDEELFGNLGMDAGKDSMPANFSRSSADVASQSGAAATISQPAINPAKIEWSQEPTLVDMRRELKSLRGLMENRLTSLAWGEQARRHPQRTRLTQELMNIGLSNSLCTELSAEQQESKDINAMWRCALGKLAHRLPISETDILDEGGVIALLGPTGVGKTTTVAKLAARFALRHGRQSVALVTTDNYRIGAHEQLRIYGRILDIPVRIANDSTELREVLNSLHDKRLVLIDTAGMSQRDVRLSEQFAVIHDGSPLVRSLLVLSATTQYLALDEAVRAFGAAEPEGCIITKTDEASSLGPVLSIVIKHKLPISYITDGQRVPEDIRIARANNLVKEAMNHKQPSEQLVEQELLSTAVEEYVSHVPG